MTIVSAVVAMLRDHAVPQTRDGMCEWLWLTRARPKNWPASRQTAKNLQRAAASISCGGLRLATALIDTVTRAIAGAGTSQQAHFSPPSSAASVSRGAARLAVPRAWMRAACSHSAHCSARHGLHRPRFPTAPTIQQQYQLSGIEPSRQRASAGLPITSTAPASPHAALLGALQPHSRHGWR